MTLFILGPLLALWIVGLPAPVINRMLDQPALRPLVVTADRLNWEPLRGLVLHRVLVYPDDSFEEPWLRVERLVLQPRIPPLLIGRLVARTIAIEQATLYAPPWSLTDSEGAYNRLIISNINATAYGSTRMLALNQFSGRMDALQIEATGRFARPAPDKEASPSIGQAFHEALTALRHAPRILPEFATWLSAVQAPTPLRLNIQFDASATGATARATLAGPAFNTADVSFDAAHAALEWRGNVFRVENARLSAGGGSAALAGSYNLSNGVIDADLKSDLPPAAWKALLFRGQRRALEAAGFDGTGLRINAHVGPAAWTSLLSTLRGEIRYDRLALRGVQTVDGQARLTGANDALHIDELSIRAGLAGERGTGRGSMVWRFHEHQLEGQLALDLNPHDFIPLLSSNQVRLVNRFTFPGAPPHFHGTFVHVPGSNQLQVSGNLTATQFTYRGVALSDMQAHLRVSNDRVTLDPWRFTQGEASTEGSLAVELHAHRADVDLRSTMHPESVAGLVGPKLHQAVGAWRFDGPVRMHARGRVDTSGSDQETDLLLDAEGARMGRGRWLADEARFTLHADHGDYRVSNLTGRAYGGDLKVTVFVEPVPAGPEHRYTIVASLTNAELGLAAESYVRPGEPPPEGRVNLSLQLTGLVSEALGPATRGSGTLEIDDGALFRLPLLGGLSELLSRLVPGLGFVAQTDLKCTFVVADSAVSTHDLQLSGDVLSMKARGDVEFEGRLNIRVEVQLLRRGPLAAILRILTKPVTKLFEFQLGGTLQDPKWRPVNLPKELFLIFD